MDDIIKQLNWRYSTKVFDREKKLTREQLELIKEAMRLSPSSYGLQAWKFVHVVDKNLREKLKQASYGQSQVTDASEFFVLTVPTEYTIEQIDSYIKSVSEIRGIKTEEMMGFRNMLAKMLDERTQGEIIEWLKKQVYIVLGQVMTVAAIEEIDACPMEGFEAGRFDAILDLGKKKLTSVVAIAFGFRSDSDKYAGMKKVRFPSNEVFVEV